MRVKTPIKISDHARITMQNRRVSKDEIFAVLMDPAIVYTNHRDLCFIKGDLCVVVVEERRFTEVKTVLFAVKDKWTDEDVRQRLKEQIIPG